MGIKKEINFSTFYFSLCYRSNTNTMQEEEYVRPEDKYSHQIYINLNSPYEWGSGWTKTKEELQKLNEHFLMILFHFGHNFFDGGYGVVQGKGFGDNPEESYMHPMQPAIYCIGRERADEIIKIFKDNPLDMYTIKSISIKDLKTGVYEHFK